MDIKQKNHENEKIIFPEDIYNTSLTTINKIQFTRRQIEIMACMLSGRSLKAIASFLSISPKTVENHIHNIKLKLNVKLRENVIDFIEKSDKLGLLKNYYFSLLVQAAFKSELKKIAPSITKQSVHCLIFHVSKQQKDELFIYRLERYLKLAGIKVIIENWQQDEHENYLTNSAELQDVTHIIYHLTESFVDQLKENNHEISTEAYKLMHTTGKSAKNVIFLCTDTEDFIKTQEKFDNFICINLAKSRNYYFSVFEILRKLLPTNAIEDNIAKFKTQCEILLEHSSSQGQTWVKENELLEKEDTSSKFSQWPNAKLNFKKRATIFAAIACVCCLILYINTRIQDLNLALHNPANGQLVNKELSKPPIQTSEKTVLNLPPRNFHFIGRRAAFEQITEQLNKQKIGIVSQVIAGLGGIGKTQIATEFAYRAIEEKAYGAILWVTAETINAINNAYLEFADQLKIGPQGLELSKIQMLVHRKLAEICGNAKVLFVLDNVPNCNNIQDYVKRLHKQWPLTSPLHILITSRSQYWSEIPLILDVFTPAESTAFVEKYLPSEPKNSITNLAKALHYFPLALSQAVAYVKEHSNIDDYLTLYANRRQIYLTRFPRGNNQYNESLWKTWHIAISKLSNEAREMLMMSAYLNPDNIPLEFFKTLTLQKRLTAVSELCKHSFIVLNNNRRSFKIHRLLQEVIRLTSKENQTYLEADLNILTALFTKNTLPIDNFKRNCKLLAHVNTILMYAEKHLTNKHIKLQAARLLNVKAYFYAQTGMAVIKNAEMFSESAKRYCEELANITTIDNNNWEDNDINIKNKVIPYAKTIYCKLSTTDLPPAVQTLLPIVYSSILYTYGRMYFYNKDYKPGKARFYLHLSKELSDLIEKHTGKKIFYKIFAESQGLLRFNRKPACTKQQLMHNISRYKALSNVQGVYTNEDNHEIAMDKDIIFKARCLKEILKNYALLAKFDVIKESEGTTVVEELLRLISKNRDYLADIISCREFEVISSYYNAIGSFYKACGNYKKAKIYFKHAINSKSNHRLVDVYYSLAEVNLRTGELDLAAANINTCLSLGKFLREKDEQLLIKAKKIQKEIENKQVQKK